MAEGSSPLTRGKHTMTRKVALNEGLIPAHAGKTAVQVFPVVDLGAHPRSRGENDVASVGGRTGRGSSPLTRGKPANTVPDCSMWRLIPAHAGKTIRSPASGTVGPAHPRSRGENTS